MQNRYLAEVMRVEEALLSVLEDSLDSTAGSWASWHVQSEVLRRQAGEDASGDRPGVGRARGSV